MSSRADSDAEPSVIRVTVWANTGGKSARRLTLSWREVVHRLERAPRKQKKKSAKLVKLATFGVKRIALRSLRHDENVLEIDGVEGDYDGEELSPETAVALLEEHGIRAVVATTWSHTREAPRWRVFAPLSGAVPPSERSRFLAALNGALGGILDPESFTLSQSYFIGGRPGGDYLVLPTFGDPDAGNCIDQLDLDEIAIYAVPTTGGGDTGRAQSVEGEIPSGERNRTLLSLGGTMRRRGMEEPEILAALLETNRGRCRPPLSEREVGRIAASVARYEPGAPPHHPEGEDNDALRSIVTLDDFYAYLPEHKYIFVPTRALWPLASVNARFGWVGEGDDAVKAAAWLDQHRFVEQMSWDPGKPQLIENQLIADGGWFDKVGVKCFNRYRPPTIDPGDPRGAGPWIEHVHLVFPGEAEQIILWVAQRVQRPGEKINHALVFQGAQGTGKDTIIEGVIPAIGTWNCHEVSPDQILGGLTPFIESVILRVSEARDLGDRDRFRFYEHTKTYAAAPPTVLRVNKKHIRQYQVPNVCGLVITTNHLDGIYLPADDRRNFVACTEKTKEDFKEEYWNELYAWFEKEGYRNVAAYLTQLDISGFNPKAPPPKTDAFWAVVDAGRAPEDAELADVLDQLEEPEAVTLAMLVGKLRENFDGDSKDHLADWLEARPNARQVPHRMEAVGYVRVRNDGAKDGRWKIDGKRVVVYARRELSVRDRIEAARRLVAGAGS